MTRSSPSDHEEAESLVREAGLLAVIRPTVTMPVPDLTLHSGPPLFSRHREGDHLVSAQYGVHRLSELAGLADDPEHAPAMVKYVADWLTAEGSDRRRTAHHPKR